MPFTRTAPARSRRPAPLAAALCLALLCLPLAAPRPAAGDAAAPPVLFQTSTLNALAAGVYDGDLTFGELKRHGDFGLGTFNALDGEMIALDGRFYRVAVDGGVSPVPDDHRTPFALVTFFTPHITHTLAEPLDFRQLQARLDGLLPSPNLLYAVRLTGRFSHLQTRSVPRQSRPYPPLAEAAKHQAVFNLAGATGTMVGFRLPPYMQGLNLPGYHCHFLTADRRAGGHVLDCRVENVRVEIAVLDRFFLRLPAGDFHLPDVTRDRLPELEKIE